MLRQRLVQRGECHQRSLKEEQDKAHVLQGPAIIGPHEEEHAGDLLIEPSWLGSIEARNLSVVCLGTFEKRADPHHTLLAHKLMGTASVASRMLSEKGWDDCNPIIHHLSHGLRFRPKRREESVRFVSGEEYISE